MKQLIDVIEGFFGNIGADIQSELSNMFSVKSMSEYYHLKLNAKLKYTEDKSAILDSLSVGDVICIESISEHRNMNKTTYIQKQDTGKFRKKVVTVWSRGSYGTIYNSKGVLRVVMNDLASSTLWDMDNTLVIKTTLIKK